MSVRSSTGDEYFEDPRNFGIVEATGIEVTIEYTPRQVFDETGALVKSHP
jgi:hypothetical protein